MTIEQLKQLVADRNMPDLETAWLEAIDRRLPVDQMASVVEALTIAGEDKTADVLASMLLEERSRELSPPEALAAARALLLAAPASDELRLRTVELYRAVCGSHEHFAALLRASGLEGAQSSRRAMRTLDISLAIRPGMYMANRFDSRVLLAKGFNDTLGEFDLAAPDGKTLRMDPKALCDEFDIVPDTDFRVLCLFRTDLLNDLLKSRPASVLVGLCLVAGGRIDAVSLKDRLVPRYIPADAWADWWSKARTAAKRSTQLTLEGKSPVVVVFHAQGRTLEQELAPRADDARGPLDRLAVLREYLREAKSRKLAPQQTFVEPLVAALAHDAQAYRHKRPTDALAAALALAAVADMGLPTPPGSQTAAAELVAQSERPAELIAGIEELDLWQSALEALAQRPDAARQLEALWPLAPASQLDQIAQRLTAAGARNAIELFVAQGMSDPVANTATSLWLWRGPATRPTNMPRRVEMLTRLLSAMNELDRAWESFDPVLRKAFCQNVRNALKSSNMAGFRQAIAEMDEHVAATIKRLIERTDGLAQAVQQDMLNILREHFFGLFATTRVEPWLDEGTLWTTEEALGRQQDEFKHLTEVKMLENARAIGAAAAHGDLSENSEWKFALEERDMLRARAAKMQDELARARVIKPQDVPADHVGVGARVRLRALQDGREVELTFLGPWDSDPSRSVLSYQTALAQALMGQRVGQTLRLKLDADEAPYEIVSIACGVQSHHRQPKGPD